MISVKTDDVIVLSACDRITGAGIYRFEKEGERTWYVMAPNGLIVQMDKHGIVGPNEARSCESSETD